MELCSIRSSSLLGVRPIFRFRCSEFPTKLRSPPLPRVKRLNFGKDLVITTKASGSDENCSGNGFPRQTSRVFMEEAIGAEYGEGFESFRKDGPLKIDVDFLNDKMQESFLQRIRYAMKPDEAFGLIFSWDNVVAPLILISHFNPNDYPGFHFTRNLATYLSNPFMRSMLASM